MDKWKQYEGITKTSKKVGGPNNLIAITFAGGAASYALINKIVGKVKNNKNNKVKEHKETKFIVNTTGFINDSLELIEGTHFMCIGRDQDAVIIRVDNENDPVVAKYDLLKKISNYE